MLENLSLPQEYIDATPAELAERIAQRKAALGERLCILGHHYQSDAVICHADLTGDSLKLSQQAGQQAEAEYIVFCGVHFMAESADILSGANQSVILPNLLAGCAMAEMADGPAVETALAELSQMTSAKVVPITYVNSTSQIKAITGRAGGACCTSSNVRNVFEWALKSEADGGAGAEKILVVPDEHLGRNTAVAMGYDESACVVYDPHLPNGGLTAEAVAEATFILWKGHCYVHQLFRVEHVESVRARHEGICVIVHPECPREIVAAADLSGSTEQIIRAVAAGAPGTKWAIGTESNLVNRLAKRHPEQFIRVLSDAPALCVQMARVTQAHLAWVLDKLAAGTIVNQVTVDAATAADAKLALERMISILAVNDVTKS